MLLANELSSHLPVYLWGPKAVRVFSTLQQGYALASTLHADSASEAVTQLRDELGVADADLAQVDLLAVMRLYETSRGEPARRVVSLHRVRGLIPLVEWDQGADEHLHHEDAELELLRDRTGRPLEQLRADLTRRTGFLESLVERGVRAIPAVHRAFATFRSEAVPVRQQAEAAS